MSLASREAAVAAPCLWRTRDDSKALGWKAACTLQAGDRGSGYQSADGTMPDSCARARRPLMLRLVPAQEARCCAGQQLQQPAKQHDLLAAQLSEHLLLLALLLLKLGAQLVAKVLCEVLVVHFLRLLGANIVGDHLQQKLLEWQRLTRPTTTTTMAAATTTAPVVAAPAHTRCTTHGRIQALTLLLLCWTRVC